VEVCQEWEEDQEALQVLYQDSEVLQMGNIIIDKKAKYLFFS
jgi:hypothetical protein